jgi:hypothetical protein
MYCTILYFTLLTLRICWFRIVTFLVRSWSTWSIDRQGNFGKGIFSKNVKAFRRRWSGYHGPWMDPLPFLFSPSIEIISYWSQELVCCNLLQASQPFTTFGYHHYMHLNSDPIDGQSVTGLPVNYEYSVISSTRTNCGFSSITQNRPVRPPLSTSKHRLISSKMPKSTWELSSLQASSCIMESFNAGCFDASYLIPLWNKATASFIGYSGLQPLSCV